MSNTFSRREWIAAFGASAAFGSTAAPAQSSKPMEGAFIIMATPYTEAKKIDYEDLAGEVDFLDKCGVQGMVWPQMASDYAYLTEDERMRGMEVIAKAAKDKKPALVLGVQAETEKQMMAFARHAESLGPDAVIAMPPKKAKSMEDYRSYYSSLCELAKRPVFIQTTGGAPDIEPSVEFIVEMARTYPNFGYVKEEFKPVIERLSALAKHRPDVIKAVFSGAGGKGWTYEMRLGFDGTMPGAMYSDIYAQLWELHKKNDREKVREVFSKLLLMINIDQQIRGVKHYVFHKRGVFKTMVSRRGEYTYSEAQKAEIDFNLQALKPYFRA